LLFDPLGDPAQDAIRMVVRLHVLAEAQILFAFLFTQEANLN
jgi:hypothetical protein